MGIGALVKEGYHHLLIEWHTRDRLLCHRRKKEKEILRENIIKHMKPFQVKSSRLLAMFYGMIYDHKRLSFNVVTLTVLRMSTTHILSLFHEEIRAEYGQ